MCVCHWDATLIPIKWRIGVDGSMGYGRVFSFSWNIHIPPLLSLNKIVVSKTVCCTCQMDSPSALISHGRRLKPEQKAVHLFPGGFSFVLPSIRHAIWLLADGGFAPHASKSSHARTAPTNPGFRSPAPANQPIAPEPPPLMYDVLESPSSLHAPPGFVPFT